MKDTDAIDRYIARMRTYARAATRLAAREAEFFRQTREHQPVTAFFHERHDAVRTARRLLAYQGYLWEARRVGRYHGGTRLRRVLPDGGTEPWAPTEAVARDPDARLMRRLWPRRLRGAVG